LRFISRFTKNEYIDVGDNITVLLIHSHTHGIKEVYIDTEDKELVKKYHWNVSKRQRTKDGFNVITPKNEELNSTLMCRLIMNAEKGQVVDHKDGDTLDNRKENLRTCTQMENGKNVALRRNNKSGHKGVLWFEYENNNTHKWKAYIMVNRKNISLGYYDDYNDAVKAREEAEIKYYGEYSRDFGNLQELNNT
jgi:hypothetical protein